MKSRKGLATGTTKNGAFWLVKTIKLRSFGGDGIGQNSSDKRTFMEIRHYRNGEVKAVIVYTASHQNSGSSINYKLIPEILDCTTIEDVIIVLKGVKIKIYDDYEESIYSDSYSEIGQLTDTGLAEAFPSPDETSL